MATELFLARTPVFSGISPVILGELAAVSTTRSLARGDYLWHAGDLPGYLTVIRAGLVKIVKTGVQGKRSICGLFGAPDSVGDAAVVRGIAYPADAIVSTQLAQLIDVPRATLMAVLDREPSLALALACAVQSKVSTLLDKIDVLSAGAVDVRLATLLLHLYARFGDDFDDGTSVVPVALSRQELADLVSTSFETAIRVMTRWEREQLVETTSTGFVLRSRTELERVAGVVI